MSLFSRWRTFPAHPTSFIILADDVLRTHICRQFAHMLCLNSSLSSAMLISSTHRAHLTCGFTPTPSHIRV
uniref:Uncharacterized protein n=1 Tax=Caenorhabditis japonica TaxID=281687 RepID=A0A8R1ICW7_CAEJA